MMKRRLTLGQGMTEYAIIVALIAISGITAFSYFGAVQRSQMAAITQELAGQESGDILDLAQSYASKARDDASRDKGLGDYYAGGGSAFTAAYSFFAINCLNKLLTCFYFLIINN